jgi:hypothetical protein
VNASIRSVTGAIIRPRSSAARSHASVIAGKVQLLIAQEVWTTAFTRTIGWLDTARSRCAAFGDGEAFCSERFDAGDRDLGFGADVASPIGVAATIDGITR